MPLPKSCRLAYEELSRKKSIEDLSESKLAKVLSALDLTSLGVGSTLGVGVYVLAGEVSKAKAGPAVVVSFLIAAIASMFAGLCYAEFGARVPKAGSAYVYSYVTIGEFIAYIIGWNLILEYSIGSASVVKGLSTYLDSLCGYAMKSYLTEHVPLNIQGLSGYPDVFAFGITILFSWAIALGAKESTILNNIFTALNLGVVLFVIVAGLFKINYKNWTIPKESIPEGYGDGGFMPYGFSGVIKGAAVCFYGFIGFDCIATAGEEAINPRKSIPFAIITSLIMIFLAYFGVSTVLTMMLPYFQQDENAPLPHVFRVNEWIIAEYIVTIGAMFGLCASLMGAMFPLPRIIFAMSDDGLLFQFMGEISSKYKTPFNGTLLAGFLTALLATVLNLTQLIDMMSIGTLLAYSMVAGCVLILRYNFEEKKTTQNKFQEEIIFIRQPIWRELLNLNNKVEPSKLTSKIVTGCTAAYWFWCLLLSLVLTKFENDFDATTTKDTLLLTFTIIPTFLTLYVISKQPVSKNKLYFKVPFVPWLPGVSILINIYLMIKLEYMTWVRFCIWIMIGLVIYFAYSLKHSKLNKKKHLVAENSQNSIFDDKC